MIHDFDASGTGWVSSDTFAAHLDYIVSKGDRVFCAPFGVVTRYIKERQCATFSLLADNGSSQTYTLSDTLSDNALFSIPITATLKLPTAWTSATVTQNGTPCWSTQRSDTLVFEAVPDGGQIVLTGAVGVTGGRRPAGSGTRIGQGAADVFMLDGRRLPPAGTRASLLRRVMP
jgi:hypothetical protein